MQDANAQRARGLYAFPLPTMDGGVDVESPGNSSTSEDEEEAYETQVTQPIELDKSTLSSRGLQLSLNAGGSATVSKVTKRSAQPRRLAAIPPNMLGRLRFNN